MHIADLVTGVTATVHSACRRDDLILRVRQNKTRLPVPEVSYAFDCRWMDLLVGDKRMIFSSARR